MVHREIGVTFTFHGDFGTGQDSVRFRETDNGHLIYNGWCVTMLHVRL